MVCGLFGQVEFGDCQSMSSKASGTLILFSFFFHFRKLFRTGNTIFRSVALKRLSTGISKDTSRGRATFKAGCNMFVKAEFWGEKIEGND